MSYGREWDKRLEVHEGDWVRFYRNAEMVIGVVQYVRLDFRLSGEVEILTDRGSLAPEYVLERRAAPPAEKEDPRA